MENINMTISVYNKDYVEGKVAKFNKVAKKLGKEPITLEFSSERIEEEVIFQDGQQVGTKVREVVDFEIVINETLRIDGYEILAMIDHTYPINNFVKTYKEIDEEYFKTLEQADCTCQHCNSKRKRNTTYIVENVGNHTRLQVGKTCLNDYVGHDILKSLNYFDLLEEIENDIKEYNMTSTREEIFLTVVDVLNFVEERITKSGYVSKKREYESGEPSTGTIIYKDIVYMYNSGKQLEESKKYYLEEIEMIQNYVTDSGYFLSLKNVLKHDYCKFKDLGLLATFFVARDIIIKEQEKEQEKVISNYVGNIGDKIQKELTLTNKFGYDTIYGYTLIYLFKDVEGNVYKWTTKSGVEMEVGETKTIKASIKAHDEYKGEKQTTILRIKIVA